MATYQVRFGDISAGVITNDFSGKILHIAPILYRFRNRYIVELEEYVLKRNGRIELVKE